MKNNIIAIDGHSSCGKSTLAKRLAAHFGFRYIDTGAMYRAVTHFALENKLIDSEKIDISKLKNLIENNALVIDFQYNSETGRSETLLNGENIENEIRSPHTSDFVSRIATLDFVRTYLVKQQQLMGKDGKLVMDGRDITTVVFPNADVKIFLTASIEVRAERRYKELIAKGEVISFDEVRDNLALRDHIDSTRDVTPLTIAPDAVVLDNSNLTVDGTFKKALEIIKR
jgi:cytidylate kinase